MTGAWVQSLSTHVVASTCAEFSAKYFGVPGVHSTHDAQRHVPG